MFENINDEKFNQNKMDIKDSISEFTNNLFDPDKRVKFDYFNEIDFGAAFDEIKSLKSEIDQWLSGKSIEEIITSPFEELIKDINGASIDAIVVAASYLTSCKLACSDMPQISLSESATDKIKESLIAFFSAPEFVNKFIQEYGIGPDKLKEAVGEFAEFTLELGKAIFYVRARLVVGIVGILDNACRAVYSMGLYALGNADLAKDVMTNSTIDKLRDYLDEILQPNDIEEKLGGIADKAGEVIGELALMVVGALELTAEAPIVAAGALAAAGILAFDEAGKSLEKNIEKSGKYSKKEFIYALVTAGLTITVERVLPCINKISNASNIYKVATKVSNVVGDKKKLGAQLTHMFIEALKSMAAVTLFEGAEKVQKVIDYALGIDENLDVKKEIIEMIGAAGGAFVIGGVLSYVGDSISRTEAFEKVMKKFIADYTRGDSVYDVIYKRAEYVREYWAELSEYSEVADTLRKELIDPEKIYKEISEKVRVNREEYFRKKSALIKEWERNTGKEWPRYTEDVYIKLKDGTEKLVRRAGDLYDAHHIKPLSWGGENVWENLTPLHVNIHFDSRGIHAIDSAFSRLTKLMEVLAA